MARPKVMTYAILPPERRFNLEAARSRITAALPLEFGLAGAERGGVGGGVARGAGTGGR